MIFTTLLLLAAPILGWWVVQYVRRHRLFFSSVASPKRHLLFANLPTLMRVVKPDRHPDYGLETIYEELGRPDCFYIDVLPLNSFLVVTSPMLAEQLTRATPRHPHSTPKSFTLSDLKPMIGAKSIISAEGEEWKSIRKQFAPGFQPKHLQTLIPLIISESKIFGEKCLEMCKSGEVFELRNLVSNFTLDVIGSVVLDETFNAQSTPLGQGCRAPNGVLTAYETVQSNITDRGTINMHLFNPMRLLRLKKHESILDAELQKMVTRASKNLDSTGRSVLNLALKDRPLTPATLQMAADQLRSFIFAGFDTTSSVIQWAIYYLNVPQNSEILKEVCAEHLAVLGPVDEEDQIDKILLSDPPLPLTTAVIKECLRLNPPAASARFLPPDQGEFSLARADGTDLQVASRTAIYICQRIIHNTPTIWGDDAKSFRPSRWLDKEYVADLPTGAFRPFERGPRSCIGQELAMLEAKILLALIVRRFAFKKTGGLTNDLGEAWNVIHITSGPHNMKMTVSER